jgi:transcriptional regulator with XRE-family HTH domain
MIGTEIRRRREELGLTGAQLAERSGLTPSAVSQIETGKRTPSSSSVMKLAAGLGCEVGDLYPKDLSPRLPLEPSGAVSQPRARSGAEGNLTIEILQGVRDGRITVEAAVHQLEQAGRRPA